MNNTNGGYNGRPYGGVSIVFKPNDTLSCHELQSDSDRMVAIAITDKHGKIVHIVINVYFPYYDRANTESFTATLDILQAFLDTHGQTAPVKICGDWNVQLPKCHKIYRTWYRQRFR